MKHYEVLFTVSELFDYSAMLKAELLDLQEMSLDKKLGDHLYSVERLKKAQERYDYVLSKVKETWDKI